MNEAITLKAQMTNVSNALVRTKDSYAKIQPLPTDLIKTLHILPLGRSHSNFFFPLKGKRAHKLTNCGNGVLKVITNYSATEISL